MLQIRDVSPPSLGSTGSAVHLCIRNFVGGLGPIGAILLHPKDSHICVPDSHVQALVCPERLCRQLAAHLPQQSQRGPRLTVIADCAIAHHA